MYQVIRRANCVRTILAVVVYSVIREWFMCLVEAQEMTVRFYFAEQYKELWQTWCMHWTENPGKIVQLD